MSSEQTTAPPIDGVEIVEPERAKHARLPSDLLRMLVALTVAALVALLGAALDDVSAGATTDLVRIAEGLANPIVVSLVLAIRLAALLVPLLIVTYMLRQRRYRRLSLVLFAAGVAALLAWLGEAQLSGVFRPEIGIPPPSWVCPPESVDGPVGGCVTASGFPTVAYLAGFSAAFSVLSPWVNRRWRIAGWVTIGVFLIARSIDGTQAPMDGLLAVALGYAIGAGTLLLFAAPDRRPSGTDIAVAMHETGIGLVRLQWADVRSKGSTPYFASTDDGRRMFVKVMGPEERAADAMYRSYRTARLRGAEERPFVSVRRAVEHEAMVSLKARADGVSTPKLISMAEVGPTSLLLAYERVDGRTLDAVRDDEIDDQVLRAVWEQVRRMRARRTAHRNLGPSNIMLDDDRTVWILDFGFAELAATDANLNADVAELLLSLSARAGPERTVAAAVDVIGADAVREAAPRLQPMAVSTSVRQLIDATRGLDEDVQDAVMAATGMEEIEFEPIERVRPRTILTVLAIGAAFYFLIPQLAQLDLGDIAGANWAWFPIIIMFSAATYVGAAWALMGSVPDHLPFTPTLRAQVASSFLNRITPAKVGGMAANVRFLQKRGIDSAVAITGVGISNVAGVIVHFALLLIFAIATGSNAGLPVETPSGEAVLVGLAVVLTLAGGVMLFPWGRRFLLRGVWPIIRKAAGGIAQIGRDPLKLLLVFGGSFVTTTSYIFALWYSIEAFGGGIGFITVAIVYLAGSAVAQAAPTPGGIGAAEAVLIAGLTAFGLASTVAVPAVFLYRIATFWLPILPGWAAFQRLQRDGAL
ncbi:MAG: lysylphosphatidylglycerol synthase transmembrane domain-containing protein [Acidimicrobiia bacterium]|nr:lysylphosphatidylglycerol synthase transmembrane domain-containing protein [Acidimicrobiia bacterium]